MRVLVLDNYDSFTFNLVQGLEAAGAECTVRRADAISVDEALRRRPDRVVLSPGPFGPERTGICAELLRRAPRSLPVLGVCLGMQVIATVAGARVVPSGSPVHGKAREIEHDGSGILRGVASPVRVGLYHSLVVAPGSVPAGLEVFATACAGGTVMGCRWSDRPVEGVLFHPESFLTEHGDRMLQNFLESNQTHHTSIMGC